MEKQNKPKTKRHYILAFCLPVFLIAFAAFTVWYYQPRHYRGNIIFELEDGYSLNIPADALPLSSLLSQGNLAGDKTSPIQNHPDTKSENATILNIQFELSAQKSFFKPEEFYGKLFIDGNEYISTFSVENSEEEPWTYPFPKYASSVLDSTAIYFPHGTGSWIGDLQAKLRGEQWVPFFVLKDQENTTNTIIVNNLQGLFEKDTSQECDLTIRIGQKTYTAKNFVLTK